jgi:hypothetical protein
VKKNFQIVVRGNAAGIPGNPGMLRRLRLWVQGLLAATMVLITLLVAIAISTTIAFVIWMVVAVFIIVAAVTAMRRQCFPRPHDSGRLSKDCWRNAKGAQR